MIIYYGEERFGVVRETRDEYLAVRLSRIDNSWISNLIYIPKDIVEGVIYGNQNRK